MGTKEQIQELREKMGGILSWYGEDCSIRSYDMAKNEKARDQILSLIKSACYLKAERELPKDPTNTSKVFVDEQEQHAFRTGYFAMGQDMLTPDPEGRVWASVYQ